MKIVYWCACLMLLVVLTGCGAGFRKTLDSESMSQHKNVTSIVKQRYTDINTMGMHGWNDFEKSNLIISSFYIPTNKMSSRSDTSTLMKDMLSICNHKGGKFKDLETTSSDNQRRLSNLREKYTVYSEEENDSFECGPVGKGTRSRDWTKFNSEVCRMLPPKKIAKTDTNKVNNEYGNPPGFGCYKENDAVFIGAISDDDNGRKTKFGSSLGSEAVKISVRLNEGIGRDIVPSSDTQSINIQ